jgi:hypothetical protein
MLKRSLSAVCLIASAGAASAQVATPPPKANPETPAFTVPEPGPAPVRATPQPTRVTPDPLAESNQRGEVPPVPYKKIAILGADGKIVRFEVPLDYEALRNNPLYGESNLPRVMPMLVGRRYRMESVVIDNLDFVLQVENGLLDDMSVADTKKMKQIVDTVTPLVPPKSITQEMFDRGLLSPVQQRFNQKLLGEYQNDIMAEFTAADPNTGLGEFMKYLMNESLKESMIAYEGLLAESTWRMNEVLEASGLASTPEAAKLSDISGSPEQGPEAVKTNAQSVRDAWKSWDLSQKQAFLRAVQETREDPHQPPVAVIDIRNPDLIDQTGERSLGVTSKGSHTLPRKKEGGGSDQGGGGE